MKIFLISLLVLLFLYPADVQAHFLATDGSIGAILHVDPNDDPIANSQATFFFEFKDKDNKFKPENCNCTFEVDQNGKKIYSKPLLQEGNKPSLYNTSISYTFPKRDIYTIRIIGKPLTHATFSPFTLSWDFRIDKEVTSQQEKSQSFFSTHTIHIVLISSLVICFVIYLISGKRRIPKKRTKRGGEKNEEDFTKRY